MDDPLGHAELTFDFTGARVLVTGGTSGIGLAVARAFDDAGADVTVTGTRPAPDDYPHDLAPFRYRCCDFARPGASADLAAQLDGLDVLVSNAGTTSPGREHLAGEFERIIGINLVAPYRLALACRPLLGASRLPGGGNLVHLASLGARVGQPGTPAYGASKAGLVQLTKTLALDWAGDRVRVNAVAPGIVETSMTRALTTDPERAAPHLARIPLGRFGSPVDVAPCVLFLASGAAGHVTGQTLLVDGGRSALG